MTNYKTILIFILFTFCGRFIYSLDVNIAYNMGNLGFSSDRGSSELSVDWGASINAAEKINDFLHFYGGVISDEISGNRLSTAIVVESTFFIVGMGPCISSFNNNQLQLKPGINGYAAVKKNEVFLFEAGIYSTLGNLSDQKNDYSQIAASLSFRLYIPGGVCTFSYSNRQFSKFITDSNSATTETTDTFSTYMLEADIYNNNFPFHLLLSLGYKNIKRIFPINDTAERTMSGIGSVFIGVGTSIKISARIYLKAGVESGLYNFTLSKEIAPSDLPDYLFNAYAAFTYKF